MASPSAAAETTDTRFTRIAAMARELGAETLAADALQERSRLVEARFFVACIGQFKRGKSTLLNVLVGRTVLPVGVVPVTSVITILRHGRDTSAVVRFATGHTQSIALDEVALFVDERQNPENRRGAVAVEITLPSPILSGGLCLVDTPGLGSVGTANTAATREFLPQIDVAIVVVGPDPPISGTELDVVEEVARDAAHILIVLNKADQLPPEPRAEVMAFTRATLEKRLGRPVERIFEVSALERIEQQRPTRDWAALEQELSQLARYDRQLLVEGAAMRATRRLGRRLLAEIAEQNAALRRPLAETDARVRRLRAALDDVDRSLRDLRFLFDAVEADLGNAFEQQRLRFVYDQLPQIEHTLRAWIVDRASRSEGGSIRRDGMEEARRLAEQSIVRWLLEMEPEAEALYQDATARFVQLVNEYFARVGVDVSGATTDETMELEGGFHVRRQFYFTSLMHVGASGPVTWVVDRMVPRARRTERVARAAVQYLAHLLDSNSHRVENDFKDRTRESRRWLESQIRSRLSETLASAVRALSTAAAKQSMAESDVAQRLDHLGALYEEVNGIASSIA